MLHYVSGDISMIYKSIWMILGAFKSCECLLSNAPKIIAIGSPVFAGDGFEIEFLAIFSVIPIENHDIQGISWKCSVFYYRESYSNGMY